MPANDDSLNYDNQNSADHLPDSPTDLVRKLLFQIARVKDLISYYEAIPDNGGQLGASLLNELVAAAYASLVDYDIVLMQKYYDLLLHCD